MVLCLMLWPRILINSKAITTEYSAMGRASFGMSAFVCLYSDYTPEYLDGVVEKARAFATKYRDVVHL